MNKVFVVKDAKVEAYGTPFVAQATGAAIRSFSDEVNRTDGESQVAKHPEDFTLFEIGEYDDQTGTMRLYEAKKALGCGIDFLRVAQPAVSMVKSG